MRAQAGCVPVRGQGPTLQVLLVTSRFTGQWIVPKGTVEPGETAEQTALREAEEEAGVRGRIGGRLGRFCYPRGHELAVVETFVLQVEEELSRWPEQGSRRRRWIGLKEALELVERPEVKAMLRSLAAGGAAACGTGRE